MNGPDPPAAVYLYSPDRRAERPASHLGQFRGVVQVDGYPGFERLCAGGNIQLAACWAHARRKFYEVHQATGSPVAAEALRRIAALYAIKATIRGQTANTRQSARRGVLQTGREPRNHDALHRVCPPFSSVGPGLLRATPVERTHVEPGRPLITVWLEVRILPGPPRSRMLPEIS